MRVLGIDTGSRTTSLAVVADGAPLATFAHTDAHPPRDAVFARLAELLDGAGLATADLEGFATAIGPGSFTGLRIGVTMAKTLSWALGRPVVGYDTVSLAALRAAWAPEGPRPDESFVAIVRGPRETVYWSVFAPSPDGPIAVGELRHDEAPQGALPFVPAGLRVFVGAEDLAAAPIVGAIAVEGPSLAEIAARRGTAAFARNEGTALEELQPLYLKPFGVGPRPWTVEDLR